MTTPQIVLPLEAIKTYCRTQPIRKLSVFGSVLRDDFAPDSDVDVLVEFEPDAPITYFELYDIQQALISIIGRQIDILTPNAISQYFRDDVLQSAVVIYEANT